jgi:hypothetical protein
MAKPLWRVSRGGHLMGGMGDVMWRRWNDLPYGIWTTKDGRQVLFNRFYEPLFERAAGELLAVAANPTEWVKDIQRQRWFYVDDDKSSDAKRRKLAEAALAVFLAGGTPEGEPAR